MAAEGMPEGSRTAVNSRETPFRSRAGILTPETDRALGREVRAELAEHGTEAFGEKYPNLDNSFEDDGPGAIQLLLGQEAGTIVWLDWPGEQLPSATRAALTRACARLGLTASAWDDATTERVLDELGDQPRRAASFRRCWSRSIISQRTSNGGCCSSASARTATNSPSDDR